MVPCQLAPSPAPCLEARFQRSSRRRPARERTLWAKVLNPCPGMHWMPPTPFTGLSDTHAAKMDACEGQVAVAAALSLEIQRSADANIPLGTCPVLWRLSSLFLWKQQQLPVLQTSFYFLNTTNFAFGGLLEDTGSDVGPLTKARSDYLRLGQNSAGLGSL